MTVRSKRYAVVRRETCVACGSCADVCPHGAIAIWHGCFAQVDAERCVGCGRCASECPSCTIHLEVRP